MCINCYFKRFEFLFQGPQELKVLVDLAIISAGETDKETARITCLHTSCLGFAPLIFDLKRSFGFDDLMRICEPVWTAMDADPALPKKLVWLVIMQLSPYCPAYAFGIFLCQVKVLVDCNSKRDR